LRIPCKGNIEGASAYVSISRAQSWHQIYLLHELWPTNVDDAKFRYIQKATKSFACDEDIKACKNILNRLSISTTSFLGENHLIISHKQIRIIVIFAMRLQVLCKHKFEAFMIIIIPKKNINFVFEFVTNLAQSINYIFMF
jgi:hypothetical protein